MLSSLDNFVIGLYLVLLVSGLLCVVQKTSAEMSSEDYFLAGKSLLVGHWCIFDCRQYFGGTDYRPVGSGFCARSGDCGL